MNLPRIIQGGMGVAVSNWRLAQAVARSGQLGVVSGTGLESVFVRRLQDGDRGGHLRRAMLHFPFPRAVEAAQRDFYVEGGKPAGTPYHVVALQRERSSPDRLERIMLASFCEVWLARQGHDGPIGVNLLTKVQLPTLPALYGAMLAGVSWVLMGAGIPREIPAALDNLAVHAPARLRLDVENATGTPEVLLELDPKAHWGDQVPPPLVRPRFVPIISSNSLATLLARKANGRVDGFVVEGPTAGGHNAPPRGGAVNERGEPVYGARDAVDLDAMRALGLPFWLAGGTGHPDGLRDALAAGAAGIQVGTLFAYAEESGLDEAIKRSALASAARGDVVVRTDARGSPTGYPFKVVDWPGNPGRDASRERICDIGYLRVAYRDEDGRLRYRCAGEPVETYVQKGGRVEDTVGRLCLCNALLSVIGHPQVRHEGALEPPVLTSGDEFVGIGRFLGGRDRYTAADVLAYLLEPAPAGAPAM